MKLEAYGIKGNLLKWIESFLVGRTQQVSVNGTRSDPQPVASGVPQGSVLGPQLFVIFINDIAEGLESDLFLFADDSKVAKLIETSADQATLQRDLQRLEDWSNTWLMKFHPGKCVVLTLGKKIDDPLPGDCHHPEYKLCGHQLEHVFQERDLGVIIDSQLLFEAHIEDKVNKANSKLGLIRRVFTFLNTKSMVQMYTALVRPHLEYNQFVWSPNKQGLINKLEKVQMRALNLIPKLYGRP